MDYQLKGKNFEVRLDLIPDLYLEVDKDRIETVVFNLISNSIKYTPSKGIITVSLKKKGKYAELKVKDTGMGLDERDINKLFKKFSRIRDTIEEANGVSIQGTGLGLYITKEIVQQHDGKIFAESEGRNKGSTFTVQFPLS